MKIQNAIYTAISVVTASATTLLTCHAAILTAQYANAFFNIFSNLSTFTDLHFHAALGSVVSVVYLCKLTHYLLQNVFYYYSNPDKPVPLSDRFSTDFRPFFGSFGL